MTKTYTSGEAARLCGLALSTLKRWVQRDALRAYRTPGGDIRIQHDDLIDFMRKYNIPMQSIRDESASISILMYLADPAQYGHIEHVLEQDYPLASVLTAESDLDFGYRLGAERPDYVILEGGPAEANLARCRALRSILSPKSLRIAMVFGSGNECATGAEEHSADGPEVVLDTNEPDWANTLLMLLLGDHGRHGAIRTAG